MYLSVELNVQWKEFCLKTDQFLESLDDLTNCTSLYRAVLANGKEHCQKNTTLMEEVDAFVYIVNRGGVIVEHATIQLKDKLNIGNYIQGYKVIPTDILYKSYMHHGPRRGCRGGDC